MSRNRIVAAVIVSISLIVGWQYRDRIMQFFKKTEAQKAQAAVAELFKAWETNKFDRLAELTFNNGGKTEFVLNMIKSPIRFRDLKISEAKRHSDGVWLVPISIKVTHIASAMSSLIDFEEMRKKMQIKLPIEVIMPPKGEALQFMSGDQEMIVFCGNEEPCAVDVCRDNKFCSRQNNLFNYALDAGRVFLDDEEKAMIDRLVEEGGNETQLRKANWLMHALANLGLSRNDADAIDKDAFQLYLKTPGGQLMIMEAKMRSLGIPVPSVNQAPPSEQF